MAENRGKNFGLFVAFAEAKSGRKAAIPSTLARTYLDHFRYLGIDAFHTPDGDPRGLKADLLILFGNARSFQGYRRLLRQRPENRPRIVVWHIEPLPPIELDPKLEKIALALLSVLGRLRMLRPIEMAICWPLFRTIAKRGFGHYSTSNENPIDSTMARTVLEAYGFIRNSVRERWLDGVYVSTTGKQNFLASRGITSTFATVGSDPMLGEDRGLLRDIDVVFIGRLKEETRRKKVERIKREVETRGAKFLIIDRDCYGEQRTALLNRAKIVLNIHRVPWETPWIRWFIAAQCGCVVASEPLTDPQPFEPGVHYVEAPFDELPATLERLLANPDEIVAAARRCADFVRNRMTAAQSIETIVASELAAARKA